MAAKREPKERLDRTTKLVLTNMIRTRIVPLLQAEVRKHQEADKLRQAAYQRDLEAWNKAAAPAQYTEFMKNPKKYIETNGLGGPKINDKALLEWYNTKHPSPTNEYSARQTEQVYFAALTDDSRHGYRDECFVLTVPEAMVPAVQQLADAIDMAFLSGTAAGLIDAIANAAKRLGEK